MPRDRLTALDGLRGVAAICVFFVHLQNHSRAPLLRMEHGRLAVDLFFLLSGFVIARAYEDKLIAGLSIGRFATIRAIRLLPVLWLAVLLYQGIWALYSVTHHHHLAVLPFLVGGAFAFLNLPDVTVPAAQAFAVVRPRWSLFYEALVNIAYAAGVRSLTGPVIWALMMASGATLIFIDPKWGLHDPAMLNSMCRTTFSFLMGTLIYRLHAGGRLWRIRLPLAAILALPVFLFALPAGFFVEAAASPIIAMVIMPLLLVAACANELGPRADLICQTLGEISYPLYLLQVPLLMWLVPLFDHIKLWPNLYAVVAIIPALGFSFFVGRLFDEPLRNELSRRLLHRRARAGIQSAP